MMYGTTVLPFLISRLFLRARGMKQDVDREICHVALALPHFTSAVIFQRPCLSSAGPRQSPGVWEVFKHSWVSLISKLLYFIPENHYSTSPNLFQSWEKSNPQRLLTGSFTVPEQGDGGLWTPPASPQGVTHEHIHKERVIHSKDHRECHFHMALPPHKNCHSLTHCQRLSVPHHPPPTHTHIDMLLPT